MKPGQRYRIITKGSGNIKPREAVFKFLAYDERADEYVFDARPLAGTQNIYGPHIQAMYETNAPLMLPQIWRGEVRVL